MIKLFENYKGLPKSMYAICFATLTNRLGEFVVPFLSLYLTQKIGMTAWASGIIITLSSIIAIPAAMIGGKIADMYGRKKIYMFAQSMGALALIPCAFTQNATITIVCLFISTFFNGLIRPAFNSMITDILPNEQRQAGFSLNYLSINLGVSIGPLIAGFLFNNFLPMLFLGDALTSMISLVLIWKYVKETPAVENTIKVENKAEIEEKGNIIQMFYKRPQLLMFFLLSIIYSFIYTQHRFSLPITMDSQFSDQGAKLFGYLMSINAITVLLLTAFLSSITRKSHQLTNMVLAGILYALGFGMLGYIHHFGFYILSTIIWTWGEILCTISSGVYVANNSPSNYRARIIAVMSIGYSVGASLSTAVSGVYIQYYGFQSLWTFIFFISLIAVLLMLGLRKYSYKIENEKYKSAVHSD